MRDRLAFRAWSYAPSYEDGEQGEKQKILKLERRLNLGFKESGMQDKGSGFIVHITGTSWMLLSRTGAQEKLDLW